MIISVKRFLREYSHSLITFLLLFILIDASLVYYEIKKKPNHRKPKPHASELLQNTFNFSILKSTDFKQLIDLPNFYFRLNHFPCRKNNSFDGEQEDIFIMTIVHSAPTNYKKREIIRKTWGSRSLINNLQMRLIFLLGSGSSQDTEYKILQEDQKYNDIVIGNFEDTYRNLTYKHVMGFKWITYYCQNAKFILKTDDDIFVDPFQLITYVKAYHLNGIPPKKYLMCFLYQSALAKRNEGSKWKVTYEEYPKKYYPNYCGGWVVLMTPDVVFGLYNHSRSTPYFWVDDVYVYGFLTEKLNIKHVDLNKKLEIAKSNITKWAKAKDLSLPPLFGNPVAIHDINLVYTLWNKTLSYYNQTSTNIAH